MKNKTNLTQPCSGIAVTENISLSVARKIPFPEVLPLIVIAFCGCFGLMNAFVSMFNISIEYFTLNFYTLFFFSICTVIFILPRKTTLAIFPMLLIFSFYLYRNFRSFEKGFKSVSNQVYKEIFPDEKPLYTIRISKFGIEDDVSLFFGFTIFILTLLICYFTIVRPSFTIGFLTSFPAIEIGLYHGKTPDLIYIIILLIFWVSLLTLDISGYYRNSGRKKTGFIKKGNVFRAKPSVRFRAAGQSGLAMIIGAVVIIAMAHSILSYSDFSRPDKLNEMRSNVKTAINDFSWDNLGESLQKLTASFRFGHITTSRHKIGNVSSVSFDGNTMLTLSLPDSSYKPKGNMYMKGYVGSVYDGKSWAPLNDSIYKENAELFNEMKHFAECHRIC